MSTAMSNITKCPTHPLAVLLNSMFFFLAPIFFLYNGGDTADYSLGRTQALTVITAVMGGIVVSANQDLVFVYNAILFFYIAIEIYIVDQVIRYADTATRPGWATTGAVVVIIHLFPFLTLPYPRIWSSLAYVGLIINTALILLAMPELGSRLLLLTGATASSLLAVSISSIGVTPCPCAWTMLRDMGTRMIEALPY